mmetsp:Transcript_7883/g.17106  ORF Transcript_7883/g.17106 Transcript_7883/m.17106 type:complete len:337 (-) Transcript_7883:146-1156(-)
MTGKLGPKDIRLATRRTYLSPSIATRSKKFSFVRLIRNRSVIRGFVSFSVLGAAALIYGRPSRNADHEYNAEYSIESAEIDRSPKMRYIPVESGNDYRRYVAEWTTAADDAPSPTLRQWAQQISGGEDGAAADFVRALDASLQGDGTDRGTGRRYESAFLEMPPFLAGGGGGGGPFEFVLIDGARSRLGRVPADHSAFADFLGSCEGRARSDCGDGCVDGAFGSVFFNLGGDAVLVSPKPPSPSSPSEIYGSYGHMAGFIRHAPSAQSAGLVAMIAGQIVAMLDGGYGTDQTCAKERVHVWPSTEGTGVPWLHFRFDLRPKYYHFDRYKYSNYNDN